MSDLEAARVHVQAAARDIVALRGMGDASVFANESSDSIRSRRQRSCSRRGPRYGATPIRRPTTLNSFWKFWRPGSRMWRVSTGWSNTPPTRVGSATMRGPGMPRRSSAMPPSVGWKPCSEQSGHYRQVPKRPDDEYERADCSDRAAGVIDRSGSSHLFPRAWLSRTSLTTKSFRVVYAPAGMPALRRISRGFRAAGGPLLGACSLRAG